MVGMPSTLWSHDETYQKGLEFQLVWQRHASSETPQQLPAIRSGPIGKSGSQVSKLGAGQDLLSRRGECSSAEELVQAAGDGRVSAAGSIETTTHL